MRSLFEWLLALGVLAGVVWIGAPLVMRWIPLTEDPVTLVESASPAMPRGVPAAAETMPFIMLPDGAIVRVGVEERALKMALPDKWLDGPRLTEEGVFGERHVLAYRFDQSRFWVILERTAPNSERRVTAIYVQ